MKVNQSFNFAGFKNKSSFFEWRIKYNWKEN